MSWGRPLTQQEWREFRGVVSFGLVLTMPLLMIIPPRRFNGITLMQLGMLGWGANEQVEYRTGRDVIAWTVGSRKTVEAPVKGAAAAAQTTEKAKVEEVLVKEDKWLVDAGAKRSRGREG
jgi:hypothetical protein